MSTQTVEARMRELEDELRRLSALYYAGTPEISDPEFDALWAELVDLEDQHPDLLSDSSPTQLLYEGVEIGELFAPAKHERPMLSLDKAYTSEEIAKWLAGFAGQNIELMPKFDGVSISLTYKAGELVRAATRGDGQTGEDVTVNVLAAPVKGLPTTLPQPLDCEVRGEMVMRRSDFDAYNVAQPDKPLANPRNGAAGTLRAKDRAKVADRPLSFMPFDLLADGFRYDEATDARLEALGFAPERFELSGIEVDENGSDERSEAIAAYIQALGDHRTDLDYEVDGVVLRVADRSVFDAAGATGHHWRAALAYKLAPEEAQTVIEDVDWQVGKSGINAPVLRVRRVFVAGTHIENVSAHNISMIAQKDLRIGDRIVIVRRGDVIPHAERVVDPAKRDGSEREIVAPNTCASCGSALVEVGESRILRCENIAGCPAQRTRRLIHWASRAAADIDAVGQVWIEKLAEDGRLAKVSDFYRLTVQDLLGYERMGTTLAAKMIASIDASKELGMRRALIGWSIPLCSEGTAKRLGRAGYASVEAVALASDEQLQQVEDIGPLVAASIVEYFARPEVQQEIRDLRALGVNLDCHTEDGPVAAPADSALSGKTVVITGTLSVGRKEFAALLEGAGAKVSGSVSKNTDYVVCGENAGSKQAKAESLGLAILSEDEARNLLA